MLYAVRVSFQSQGNVANCDRNRKCFHSLAQQFEPIASLKGRFKEQEFTGTTFTSKNFKVTGTTNDNSSTNLPGGIAIFDDYEAASAFKIHWDKAVTDTGIEAKIEENITLDLSPQPEKDYL